MKKYVFFLLCLLLASSSLTAQTLQGTIYDSATKEPVPGVYVYLDGTSLYTSTDANGKFTLKVDKIINTQLVLSHVAYSTLTFPKPFQQLPDKFYLKEKVNTLKEVVIRADQFTRAQKLKAFREQFLGTTKCGRSCRIENEDDIQLRYDKNTQSLTATADKPIVIINNFLAYKIHFTLVNFKAQFLRNRIEIDYAKQSFFAGTSLFIDLKPGDRKIQKRRDEVYEYSANHFFKNLAKKTIETSKYKVFNEESQTNPYLYFDVTDTLSQTLISIKPNTAINKTKKGFNQPLSGTISVLYRKAQSEIYFLTDTFLVDQYGNIDAIDRVLFGGYFGDLRAGDLLPLDYVAK